MRRLVILFGLIIGMVLAFSGVVSAQGQCVGTGEFTPDSSWDASTCAPVYGCYLIPPTCDGTIDCSDFTNDYGSCIFYGCDYDEETSECSGSPNACADYSYDQTDCSNAGCTYIASVCCNMYAPNPPPGCGGGCDHCADFTDQATCESVPGPGTICTWEGCVDADGDSVDACDAEGNPIAGCSDPCDCDDTNPLHWRYIDGLYTDNDKDGYCIGSLQDHVCVGADSVYEGRTYYVGSNLAVAESCIAFTDLDDGNPNIGEGGGPTVPEFSPVGVGIATFVVGLVCAMLMRSEKKKK